MYKLAIALVLTTLAQTANAGLLDKIKDLNKELKDGVEKIQKELDSYQEVIDDADKKEEQPQQTASPQHTRTRPAPSSTPKPTLQESTAETSNPTVATTTQSATKDAEQKAPPKKTESDIEYITISSPNVKTIRDLHFSSYKGEWIMNTLPLALSETPQNNNNKPKHFNADIFWKLSDPDAPTINKDKIKQDYCKTECRRFGSAINYFTQDEKTWFIPC